MKSSGYKMCPAEGGCDTIFNREDVVYYQALKKVEDGILAGVQEYINWEKIELASPPNGNVNQGAIGIINKAEHKLKQLIQEQFRQITVPA